MDLILIICISWCLAVSVQLYYWCLPKQESSTTGKKETVPAVSVVVCVNQHTPKLARLLQSLAVQSNQNYELIVVNDGPDKHISEVLQSHSHLRQLTTIDFDASMKVLPGKKAPLTAGIRAAQNAWLLLTDADCVPGPEWIDQMMKEVNDSSRLVLGIAPFFHQPGLLNLLQRFDGFVIAIQYIGAALRNQAYMGVGRNLLYHKSLYHEANGFSDHAHIVSGDDDLFVQSASEKTSTRVCLNEESFVYSEAPQSWSAWLHQKRRHLSTGSSYKPKAQLKTVLFAISWLVMWIGFPVVFLSGKAWFLAGIVILALLWILFSKSAMHLRSKDMIPWFPVLGVCYCILICTFAVLLTSGAPKTWMKS